ncbi:acetoacetyl-CoA synthetase [Trichonephila clavipes]|nr:acetoacetyl-CoA synthetase [Trichonephila clavipes]
MRFCKITVPNVFGYLKLDAEDNTEYISYKKLYDEVRVYVKALKNEGIKKGDNIACYMSNKKEAVIAFLATAAIGAVWTGILPLFGTKATIVRLEQIQPKLLLTSGDFKFDNVDYKLVDRLPEIISSLPNLQKVIYCPSKSKNKTEDISKLPKCVYISEFLHPAREALRDDPADLQFEQLPFDQPLFISFTSGTTGAPKSLVHSAGMFMANVRDYGLHQNCTRKDTLYNQSPVGWISWGMFVNSLHLGVSLVLYDGDPFQESPTRFWDLVDKYDIASVYIWSSTVEYMDIHGWTPTSKHSLKNLRQMFPIGSPTKPRCFDFLAEKVKPGLFCAPVYGSTEVFGSICGVDSNLPVYRGELQAFSLGMDIRILDEKGNPVIGERGDVVLANPYPALPVSILDDENKEKINELYLDRYPVIRQVIYSQFGLAIHQNHHQATRRFVEWAQNEIAVVPDFHKRILFSDEAHFWLNGYVNKQNCRIWSESNPQVYVETPLHPEKLTVWCALWAGGIIGPYFFKNDEGHNVTVNGDRYRAMITNFFIPELNNHDVQELWFQQDGATCHTARATIDLLKDTFRDRLISRFGPVKWPPRSCDLTPLDYFLWGYVKSLVYADKPQTLEDNIRRVIADIRPQMLEKVIENWTSRLDYIRASRGCPMPDIIFKM